MKRARTWLLGALGVAVAVGVPVGLWYAFPVRTVVVEGNRFIPDARAAELAGLTPGFGWLYYGAWRARDLESHPWVRSSRVTRVWPDTVRVEVAERVPSARLAQDGRVRVIDWDGTPLPGARPAGPLISGWGPDRTREAIAAARLLAEFEVRAVQYTPSGLKVQTERGTLWSGSYSSLQKYAAGVRIYPGQRVNIYPWGVSVQE